MQIIKENKKDVSYVIKLINNHFEEAIVLLNNILTSTPKAVLAYCMSIAPPLEY